MRLAAVVLALPIAGCFATVPIQQVQTMTIPVRLGETSVPVEATAQVNCRNYVVVLKCNWRTDTKRIN